MSNANLYRATITPNRSIENTQRAMRVFSYLFEHDERALYQDIRRDLGLSYRQCVVAVGLLCSLELVAVNVQATWNGQNYVYPHTVSVL